MMAVGMIYDGHKISPLVISWLVKAHEAFKARARAQWAKNRGKKAAQLKARRQDLVKGAMMRAGLRQYRANNKGRVAVWEATKRERHSEKIAAYRKAYAIRNQGVLRQKARSKASNSPEAQRARRLKNLEAYRKKARERERRKLAENPGLRVLARMRSRLSGLCKNNGRKWSVTLGMGAPEIREHLEGRFMPGMSWENYGNGPGKWHVDHIVPCSKFDLTNPNEVRKCFALSNLQPLWSQDNIRKSNKTLKQAEFELVA